MDIRIYLVPCTKSAEYFSFSDIVIYIISLESFQNIESIIETTLEICSRIHHVYHLVIFGKI